MNIMKYFTLCNNDVAKCCRTRSLKLFCFRALYHGVLPYHQLENENWEIKTSGDWRRVQKNSEKKKMLMIKWRCSFSLVFKGLLSLFSRTESRALLTYSELELSMTSIAGLWRELNLHLISINSFGDIILNIQM